MTKYIQTLPETHWLTRLRRAISYGDIPWKWIIIAASILVMVLIFAIGEMLWRESADARNAFGFNFITPTKTPNWDPVNNEFQAWPFIYGTLLTSVAAIILALPISIGIAIFMSELCPEWLKLLVELAGRIACRDPQCCLRLVGHLCLPAGRCGTRR